MTITPQHRQAAARVAALLEAKLEAKALSARPWTAFELAFYTLLRKMLGAEALALAEQVLRDGPSAIDNPFWWQMHEATLIDELTNSIAQVARFGAQAGREALGAPRLSVNWGLVNRSAVDWAGQHAAELVRSIEPVTRAALRQAVSDWAQSGQPLTALADKIRALSDPATGQIFGAARARRIAQTESTNAYAAGNVLAWQAAGVRPAAFQPAAHVQCRCWLMPWRTPEGDTVMVWHTAADERVCVRPIQTPWAQVDGCQDLDGTIVSWGAYLGTKRP